MTRIHLRYVDRFIDRHSHTRHYFRRPGGRRIPLPGLPGSDEFMAAYRTALAGEDAPATKPKVRGEPGTFSRLTVQYFVSPEFLRLRTRTQYVYRLVIERFLAEHGHRRVVEMRRDDVKKIMALKSATPGAANDLLKQIRTLIAIDVGWRTVDPTLRIKTFPEHEFHTWTEDEIVNTRSDGLSAHANGRLSLYTSTRVSAAPTLHAWLGQTWRKTPSTSCRLRPAFGSPFRFTRTCLRRFERGHANT
jgi:hypothetical protein